MNPLPWRRWARALLCAAENVGLMYLVIPHSGQLQQDRRSEGLVDRSPGAGHPERVVALSSLSPAEQDEWLRLTESAQPDPGE